MTKIMNDKDGIEILEVIMKKTQLEELLKETKRTPASELRRPGMFFSKTHQVGALEIQIEDCEEMITELKRKAEEEIDSSDCVDENGEFDPLAFITKLQS